MSVATIAQPSAQSLVIQPLRDGQVIATGTAFVVVDNDAPYLITNRHNVTGRNADNQPVRPNSVMPNKLRIWHNREDRLGEWLTVDEPLYGQPGEPLWLEHPQHGRKVDVVALPLTVLSSVQLYPYDHRASELSPVATGVTTDLSIIGFPFGLTSGGMLGVWSRGTVATEPNIDYGELPLFLVDSRTRQGQSGSPVIYFSTGGAMTMKDGSTAISAGETTVLLGVYSGRVNAESDLGLVWKVRVIREIIEGGIRPDGPSLMP